MLEYRTLQLVSTSDTVCEIADVDLTSLKSDMLKHFGLEMTKEKRWQTQNSIWDTVGVCHEKS